MKSNPNKHKVMKMSKKTRPELDYQLTMSVLQEPTCERDLGIYLLLNLPSENYITRVVQGAKYILVTVKIHFKYVDKEMFRNVITKHARPKSEYTSLVWSLTYRHRDLLDVVKSRAIRIMPEERDLRYIEEDYIHKLLTQEE